jgi:Outer membrane protein beta-barrel domain
MKSGKIVLSLAFVVIVVTTRAQKAAPISFRLRGGVNFQNINGKNPADSKMENKLKTGFHLGATADIPIAPDFAVQTGLLFSTKGTKFEGSGFKLTVSYIEIPILFLHTPKLGNDRLLLGVGPYVAVGIGGKLKRETVSDLSVSFRNTIPATTTSGDKTYLKRMDMGANLLAGYELSNSIFVQLNAQLGLIKINPGIENLSGNKTSWKNTGFGLSVGYHLGGGK